MDSSDSDMSDLENTPPPPIPGGMDGAAPIVDMNMIMYSELSDIRKTPPPPTSDLRPIAKRPPPRLSNQELDAMIFPESSLRSSVPNDQLDKIEDDDYYNHIFATTLHVLETLPEIQLGETDKLRAAAREMVDLINKCYDPARDSPTAMATIEKVQSSLTLWKFELDHDDLVKNFQDAVRRHPDIVMAFQTFLPQRYRKSWEEIWEDKRRLIIPTADLDLEGGSLGFMVEELGDFP